MLLQWMGALHSESNGRMAPDERISGVPGAGSER
jgi:hypothetical protein